MSTHRAPQPRPNGFTLIEIVIALVLLGILGIVGSRVFTASVYTNEAISNSNMAYASARYALERVSRETREMDVTASLAASSLTVTASQLSFIKTGPGQQTVTFTFSGNFATGDGTLSMAYGPNPNNNSHLLATHLSAGSFAYYASVGALSATLPQPDASDLHFVFIRLKTKPDPTLSQEFTLSNLIYLHNT